MLDPLRTVREHRWMFRVGRARVLLVVFLFGCTPIRGLDVPGEDAAGRADAALDAEGVDAATVDAALDAPPLDAPLVDARTDAGCSGVELCNRVDDDCDPSTDDGSADPSLGMPCDGADPDTCEEGVFLGCVGGALSCGDTTGDSVEACDGLLDEDCDGAVDEAGATGSTAYYPDADADGFGEDAGVVTACAPPVGARFVTRGGDCDDTSPMIRPGRAENCDGIDQDCDGSIDDGVTCEFSCSREEHGGHVYQLCTTQRAQATARSRCEGFGYHLVQIDDALENDFVRSLLGPGFPALSDLWIGLEAVGAPAVHTWPDGTAATYTAWGAGEPNGTGTCVRTRDTGWADAPCGTNYPYLCEAP